jgi:hypothetical protein
MNFDLNFDFGLLWMFLSARNFSYEFGAMVGRAGRDGIMLDCYSRNWADV